VFGRDVVCEQASLPFFAVFAASTIKKERTPNHRLVETWRSEDRKNPGNSGNAKVEYNVLMTVKFFSTKAGKGGENYRP